MQVPVLGQGEEGEKVTHRRLSVFDRVLLSVFSLLCVAFLIALFVCWLTSQLIIRGLLDAGIVSVSCISLLVVSSIGLHMAVTGKERKSG